MPSYIKRPTNRFWTGRIDTLEYRRLLLSLRREFPGCRLTEGYPFLPYGGIELFIPTQRNLFRKRGFRFPNWEIFVSNNTNPLYRHLYYSDVEPLTYVIQIFDRIIK